MGDTTKRQIKKGSPEDKIKKKFLDTNPLFKLEKKAKKFLKEKLNKKSKKNMTMKQIKNQANVRPIKSKETSASFFFKDGERPDKDIRGTKGRLAKMVKAKEKANKPGGKNYPKTMMASKTRMKKGGMADLTGDGKITRADVLKGRGVFKRGGKVKGYAPGGTVKEDEKQRRRSEGAPVRYTPPRRRKPKPSDPAVFKRKKDNRGNERSIDAEKRRRGERKGMNCGGTVIMDRNYLKGK